MRKASPIHWRPISRQNVYKYHCVPNLSHRASLKIVCQPAQIRKYESKYCHAGISSWGCLEWRCLFDPLGMFIRLHAQDSQASIFLKFFASSIAWGVYHAYFHPLSKFPGPKLWAAYRFTSVYSSITGRVPKKVLDFHRTYGPVVRIFQMSCLLPLLKPGMTFMEYRVQKMILNMA